MYSNPKIQAEEVRFLSGLRSDVPEGSLLPSRIPEWVRTKLLGFVKSGNRELKFTRSELRSRGVKFVEPSLISDIVVSNEVPAGESERSAMASNIRRRILAAIQ